MASTGDNEKEKWSEPSFEEWVEKMLREGYTEIVKYAVNLLPENKKEKYRSLYKRIQAEKKASE